MVYHQRDPPRESHWLRHQGIKEGVQMAASKKEVMPLPTLKENKMVEYWIFTGKTMESDITTNTSYHI